MTIPVFVVNSTEAKFDSFIKKLGTTLDILSIPPGSPGAMPPRPGVTFTDLTKIAAFAAVAAAVIQLYNSLPNDNNAGAPPPPPPPPGNPPGGGPGGDNNNDGKPPKPPSPPLKDPDAQEQKESSPDSSPALAQTQPKPKPNEVQTQTPPPFPFWSPHKPRKFAEDKYPMWANSDALKLAFEAKTNLDNPDYDHSAALIEYNSAIGKLSHSEEDSLLLRMYSNRHDLYKDKQDALNELNKGLLAEIEANNKAKADKIASMPVSIDPNQLKPVTKPTVEETLKEANRVEAQRLADELANDPLYQSKKRDAELLAMQEYQDAQKQKVTSQPQAADESQKELDNYNAYVAKEAEEKAKKEFAESPSAAIDEYLNALDEGKTNAEALQVLRESLQSEDSSLITYIPDESTSFQQSCDSRSSIPNQFYCNFVANLNKGQDFETAMTSTKAGFTGSQASFNLNSEAGKESIKLESMTADQKQALCDATYSGPSAAWMYAFNLARSKNESFMASKRAGDAADEAARRSA